VLGPGVVVGPHALIGDGTRVAPNTVIGRGVAIGRDCEIGSNVSISDAYLGDQLLILPGAQIGQPGFGFVSSAQGHVKIPQLGRVIVQDKVEIGACVTIDRGALGDTVIGEGTKIDNLVQIGHNVHLGRHCVIVGQAGVAGSAVLGDFVVTGGQVAVADHCRVGNGARLAGRAGVVSRQEIEGLYRILASVIPALFTSICRPPQSFTTSSTTAIRWTTPRIASSWSARASMISKIACKTACAGLPPTAYTRHSLPRT